METPTAFVSLCPSGWVNGTPLRGCTTSVHSGTMGLRLGSRWRRRDARMEASDGDAAEDEAPSDTFVPPSLPDLGNGERTRLVARLLRLCAATSRGQTATDVQGAAVESAASALEAMSVETEPVNAPAFDGTWSLVYASTPLFRSSPLLLAAATPLLQLGAVRQRIDLGAGLVDTEVDVVAFPATTAVVRTAARATPVGADRVELAVDKSTVVGGKVAGRIDLGGLKVDLPVAQIYERVKRAAPETYFDTYYLDDNLRISRSKNNTLYIYVKE